MIRLIEALNFRCLRYIHQPLNNFHVFVGPNASGKTTFLDVAAFLGQLVSEGLEATVHERTHNFQDLVWQRCGDAFELAVELEIPEQRRRSLQRPEFNTVRYEVSTGLDKETGEVAIRSEKVLLKEHVVETQHEIQRSLFPVEPEPPETIMTPKGTRNTKTVVHKAQGGNDNFYDETGKGWDHSFKLGPRKSALGNLPDDETKFPAATWLKGLLAAGVHRLILNSVLMRKPSPPGQPKSFRPDGSNLPWVIHALNEKHPDRMKQWIEHLKTALPDLEDIRITDREEDRHRYLKVRYTNNLEIPSWTVSDGTLRLLALTLPTFLPESEGVYLIEEPENGIHPKAVETAFHALSSAEVIQIMMATHSQVILSAAKVSQILCFSKTESGATDIVSGHEHPALRDWKGEPDLGVLFARGVLG